MNIKDIIWDRLAGFGRYIENGKFQRTKLDYEILDSGLRPHNVQFQHLDDLAAALAEAINKKRTTEKHKYGVEFGVSREHLPVSNSGRTEDINVVKLCVTYDGRQYAGMSDHAINIALSYEVDGLEAEAEKFVAIMRSNHAEVFEREKQGF